MREPIKYRLAWFAIIAMLVFFFALSLTSCAVFKHKHSEYQKTDSTSKVVEKDSQKLKVDSVSTHEKTSEEENSIVIDFGDKGMVVVPKSGNDSGIYVHPTNPEDYFTLTWDGSNLLTSVKPKSVTIKGSSRKSEKDSAVKNMEVLQDHSRIEETAVTNIHKEVTKEKKSFNLLWLLWLLLIPVGYYVYKNRDKIWRWVIKVTTGIKTTNPGDQPGRGDHDFHEIQIQYKNKQLKSNIMKSKTLALIFIASMVAAFALTTIGDNSGNKGMFWLGIVSLSVMIVSGVMWWKQQDQE